MTYTTYKMFNRPMRQQPSVNDIREYTPPEELPASMLESLLLPEESARVYERFVQAPVQKDTPAPVVINSDLLSEMKQIKYILFALFIAIFLVIVILIVKKT